MLPMNVRDFTATVALPILSPCYICQLGSFVCASLAGMWLARIPSFQFWNTAPKFYPKDFSNSASWPRKKMTHSTIIFPWVERHKRDWCWCDSQKEDPYPSDCFWTSRLRALILLTSWLTGIPATLWVRFAFSGHIYIPSSNLPSIDIHVKLCQSMANVRQDQRTLSLECPNSYGVSSLLWLVRREVKFCVSEGHHWNEWWRGQITDQCWYPYNENMKRSGQYQDWKVTCVIWDVIRVGSS